jgi:hypothetical protein
MLELVYKHTQSDKTRGSLLFRILVVEIREYIYGYGIAISYPSQYYRDTVLSSKRTESISLHFCRGYMCSTKGYRLDISTSTNTTDYKRAQHLSVKQIKIWLLRLRMGLHLHIKNRCATNLSAPARLNQVINIKEEEKQTTDNGIPPPPQAFLLNQIATVSCLSTASSKINYPAYLSSTLLLSSPCYCIPSIVLLDMLHHLMYIATSKDRQILLA